MNVVGCDNMVYDIDIARWDYDRRVPQRGYHWCKADKVIAWMPLPDPYREDDTDYEHAVDQLEHDIRWESTFNPDDGSM